MPALHPNLRNKLEKAVVKARDEAEAAARAALERLAVDGAKPFEHLDDQQRLLRNKLRAHARQLGDKLRRNDAQEITHLVGECAYEHWHRMLFARFLAENSLLMHPEGVAVTLEECDELAAEEGTDRWTLAAEYASRMLPQIFRPDDPLLQVTLAPEDKRTLERLVANLPTDVFTADDSLGWCYQFWQTKRKEEVNKSEVKIGADELPAVTQLFTEDYMVRFLLHNSLGAWWSGKQQPSGSTEDQLRKTLSGTLDDYEFDYLRFTCSTAAPGCEEEEEAAANPTTPTAEGGCATAKPTKSEYRRNLPHLQVQGKSYFITFCTHERWTLPEPARELVLKHCLHDHQSKVWIHAAVVMPDHVHLVMTPLDDKQGNPFGLSEILGGIKGASAHSVNKLLKRKGHVWQDESFDHVLRREEKLEEKVEYILANPIRKGLAPAPNAYPYLWTENVAQPPPAGKLSENDIPSNSPQPRAAGPHWKPASGTFDGWPRKAAELKILDPCCGSGHFLVAVFELMARIRMAEEGLSRNDATDAVIRDNLFGLEIDPRCTQLAAFSVAMAAWRFCGSYRQLPPMNIACSGLAPNTKREDWKQLAGDDKNLSVALGWLYDEFKNAPTLGSLINPATSESSKLVDWKHLVPLMQEATREETDDLDQHELGITARGIADAARLLADKYHLVITNVPYRKRANHCEILREHISQYHPNGKADLATGFIERCLVFCAQDGSTALVTPQNWLFQKYYDKLREKLLKQETWNHVARLGAGAFDTISGEVVNVVLLVHTQAQADADHILTGLDASKPRTAREKACLLQTAKIQSALQERQLENPDCRVTVEEGSELPLLEGYATNHQGLSTGDNPRFRRESWEITEFADDWEPEQSTVQSTCHFGGRSGIILWEKGKGMLWAFGRENVKALHNVDRRGEEAWGHAGVGISQMQSLPATLYCGHKFDTNVATIVPRDPEHCPAIWCFCSSPQFNEEVRTIDQALKVTNATLVKVPFDLEHWKKVAAEKYPNGLPKPYSDDLTQWIFHGRPERSTDPLQVAVARLLGYRWPAELECSTAALGCENVARPPSTGESGKSKSTAISTAEGGCATEMELSDEARGLVRLCDELLDLVDDDGIVGIPPVRGELPAADRVREMLARAYGDDWSPLKEGQLLADAGFANKTLDLWLRDGFFKQHCKLFQNRPFIWHIWDGHKMGFQALVNYHRLADGQQGYKLLETLAFTYLGDWIRQLEKAQGSGGTAETRLIHARALQENLHRILDGQSPHDIFVRWKPLEEQPIGWRPDLNDGVRMNIRPFMSVDQPGAKKGSGVLREKPNIKWTKDRGKDVESAPWYNLGPEYDGNPGDRINEHHLTLEEKQKQNNSKGK